ncbi:hypothetical protein TRIATDRAFT_87403 [Trichoderma atroviride IMI 206040]|uniref:Uncharacterized protein n=1 Tax=Hypocrea atroviridis (strain ATCC 20476 / IMI 206040) TaxID=452589 RepID=G9NY25_HYPAI|nr:uncharacterized protein TRIATDRAFT_87403 [Trichoderma atroviride IMI 206040]EHK44353.1 hypothetical protein TRIATDRAFT_87403 [Trichoderma atroviride IMI 206040]
MDSVMYIACISKTLARGHLIQKFMLAYMRQVVLMQTWDKLRDIAITHHRYDYLILPDVKLRPKLFCKGSGVMSTDTSKKKSTELVWKWPRHSRKGGPFSHQTPDYGQKRTAGYLVLNRSLLAKYKNYGLRRGKEIV